MKTIDRFFFWSIALFIMLFMAIKESANDMPDGVLFVSVVIASMLIGYALMIYPILTVIENKYDAYRDNGE